MHGHTAGTENHDDGHDDGGGDDEDWLILFIRMRSWM